MADAFTSVPVKPTLSSYWWAARNPPADPKTSFAGKTVLITGANVGLGFEAAIKFAALGASNLILGVRSLPKGEQAKAKIEARTGCSAGVIQLIELDMSRYQSIEKFFQQVNRRFTVVHAAVLNAGVFQRSYELSTEGWEMSIQVNAISTAYLGILLLPKLRETGLSTGRAAHLEIVASCAQGDANVKNVRDPSSILQKINDPKHFGIGSQYSISKLLAMWVTTHIAAEVPVEQVIVSACCPSMCKSNLTDNWGFVLHGIDTFSRSILGRTTEEGSRTLVSGTLLGPEGHGGFWTHDRIAKPAALVVSDEGKKLGTQCWKEILNLLRRQNPEVDLILKG
ncbi:hypothetical protein RJZ56_007141 [Blastomyces dermatitidis]|uniref:Short-chain dehydrogenase/reductase n=1 Tax=Blastomyces gilchristii (strain SLH14081) TaxID=559298 RepID=A0A179V0L0_BLAGS|nr:short-chain dehydrogenase/reductase [Blastomyces gilchristii SLH14081]EQL29140.1 hypothetical protein BDFG_08177 [Blastomyces dermatitidis ATCC 26199]OAT13620.1 short-chain dehydrogenase/reductase [Blastomyces gilchristii SLH14081]